MKMHRALTTTVPGFLSSGFLGWNGAGAFAGNCLPPDVTPPQLAGLVFAPPVVDTTYGPADEVISLHITDNSSGFISGIYIISTPDGNSLYGPVSLPAVSGTTTDGIFEFRITLPHQGGAGTYTVTQLTLNDVCGNTTTLGAAELAAKGFPSQFEVTFTPMDIVPPDIVEVSIDPPVVDVTSADQTVEVTLRITDSFSGFHGGTASFTDSPYGVKTILTAAIPPIPVIGDIYDGTYIVPFVVPRFLIPFPFNLSLTLSDGVNSIDYSASYLQSHGLQYSLTVLDGTPDVHAPVLGSIAISPASIEPASLPRTLDVTAVATDDLSGLATSTLTLTSPTGATIVPIDLIPAAPLTSTALLTGSVTLPAGTETGLWNLSLTLRDAAINEVTLNADGLNQAGFQGTLSIFAGPDMQFVDLTNNLPVAARANAAHRLVLTATVHNAGPEDATSVNTLFFLDTNFNHQYDTGDVTTVTVLPVLAAGQTASITGIFTTVPPVLDLAGVIVDPGNAISEASETNNSGTVDTFVGQKVDLRLFDPKVITPISDRCPGATGCPLYDAKWTIAAYNSGPVMVHNVLVSFGEMIPTLVDSIPAGGSVIVSHTYKALAPGRYTFRFTIDPGNKIPETNELNNQTVIRNYCIGSNCNGGPDGPALRK